MLEFDNPQSFPVLYSGYIQHVSHTVWNKCKFYAQVENPFNLRPCVFTSVSAMQAASKISFIHSEYIFNTCHLPGRRSDGGHISMTVPQTPPPPCRHYNQLMHCQGNGPSPHASRKQTQSNLVQMLLGAQGICSSGQVYCPPVCVPILLLSLILQKSSASVM